MFQLSSCQKLLRLQAVGWLPHIYPGLGDASAVRGDIAALQGHDFIQLERAEPEREYLFKHLITREVAYEQLALQTRSSLHEQVGMFIEQHYPRISC